MICITFLVMVEQISKVGIKKVFFELESLLLYALIIIYHLIYINNFNNSYYDNYNGFMFSLTLKHFTKPRLTVV